VRWGSIASTISSLERLLQKYDIPLAVIDGPRLAELSILEMLQTKELLSCIANLEQIQPLLALQRKSADTRQKRKDKAAVAVQSCIRGFLARRHAAFILKEDQAAVLIQSFLKTMTSMMRARRALRKKQKQGTLQWNKMREKLVSLWPAIMSGQEHTIVHLPSLSVEEHLRINMRDLAHPQNLQLPRIFDCVLNTNTVVIYVAPCHIPKEVMEYNMQLVKRWSRHRPNRLHIIVPENYDRFPPHFPLASLILYSPKCLQRLRTLLRGKNAYIVPGLAGWPEKKLAELLDVPLLGPDPGVRQLYAARSSMKRILIEANVNIALGAHDVYDEESLLLSLSRLIAGNPFTDRWIVKIDVDYDNLSWAYLEVTKLSCISLLRREKIKLEELNDDKPAVWHHQDIQILARTKVLQELKTCLDRIMVICNPSLYPAWGSFLAYVRRYGAVIDAEPKSIRGYPSVSLFIDPLGNASVRGTYDLVFDASTYKRVGALYPCTTIPYKALEGASLSIARRLFEREVIGYVTINFVAFNDEAGKERMWALDTIPALSDYASSKALFELIHRGTDTASIPNVQCKSIESPASHGKPKFLHL